MANTLVYEDETRRITLSEGGTLSIHANGQQRQSYAPDLIISNTLPTGAAGAIRQLGDSPERWYTLLHRQSGRPFAVMAPQTRYAVGLALATATAEHEQIINNPAHKARRAVTALFAKAHRLQDDPVRYVPALHEAETALKHWREQYPSAAKAERREALLADADELECTAKGALVYDADGILSSAEQHARHDRWMAEAAAKRAEAWGD